MMNNGKKIAQSAKVSKPIAFHRYPIPACSPFRPSSCYAQVFAILYAHRNNGITREKLLAEMKTISTKPDKLLKYCINIVCSPSDDGSAHKSVFSAANVYFVEKGWRFLRLHLREQRNVA